MILTASETHDAVKKFWNDKPCDSEVSCLSPETQAYFEEIERERYSYQGHILDCFDQIDWHNKKVLEIGTGVGTDARQLIARGAAFHGINVDEGSCAMTRRAFAVFGVPGTVEQMDATAMQFPDATFDVVYAFGVLHHIPEVSKAVAEIHRVLRHSGRLLFMVYNRSSINYRIEIRLLRKFGLRLLLVPGAIELFGLLGFQKEKLRRHAELFKNLGRMTDQEWLSRNTDGPDNPYSVVYGRSDIEDLLANRFRVLSTEVHYFDPRHWGPVKWLLPKRVTKFLGRHWGWHRVVLATRL